MKILLQVCAVTVVLTAFYAVAVGWSLGTVLSSFLTASTLALACNGVSATKRNEKIAILAWLYWGLSYVSNLVEALYFHVIPILDAQRSIAVGLALALLVACILAGLDTAKRLEMNRLQVLEMNRLQVRIAPHLWWRIPLLAIVFFVVYLAAGAGVFHWVASFYQNRPLPSVGQLFKLQVCRGLLDTACMFPLLRRWNGSRRSAAWLSACVFTVLCGWGPLLLPNRFMPGPIRLAHAIEMGASGIAFGIITVMLLLKPKRLEPAEHITSNSNDLGIATS